MLKYIEECVLKIRSANQDYYQKYLSSVFGGQYINYHLYESNNNR